MVAQLVQFLRVHSRRSTFFSKYNATDVIQERRDLMAHTRWRLTLSVAHPPARDLPFIISQVFFLGPSLDTSKTNLLLQRGIDTTNEHFRCGQEANLAYKWTPPKWIFDGSTNASSCVVNDRMPYECAMPKLSVQGVLGRQGQVRGGATLSLLYIATLLYCLYCTYSTYIYIHIIFYKYIYTYTWTYYCLYI